MIYEVDVKVKVEAGTTTAAGAKVLEAIMADPGLEAVTIYIEQVDSDPPPVT